MRLVHTANSRAAKQPASRKSAVRRDSLASAHPAVSAALHSSVLVLNRLYMAVHVIGVRRAFALLCRELAEVIHPATKECSPTTRSSRGWRRANRGPIKSSRTKTGFAR